MHRPRPACSHPSVSLCSMTLTGALPPAPAPSFLCPQVAEFVDRAVQIAGEVKKASKGTKLKDFREALESSEPPALGVLRREVEDFAKQVGVCVCGWVGPSCGSRASCGLDWVSHWDSGV